MTLATFGSGCIVAQPRSLYLMLAARCLIGFSHGYAYVTVLVHASEIVTQKLRGLTMAAINLIIVAGILTTGALLMTLSSEQHGFGAMQWVGILGLIYSVMGFIFIAILSRESPVAMIKEKKFDQAMALMMRVRNESTETWSIRNEYNELKAMVEEDKQTSRNIKTDGNLRPLMLVTLLKIGSVLCFNFGLNLIRLRYTGLFYSDEGYNIAVVIFMVRF